MFVVTACSLFILDTYIFFVYINFSRRLHENIRKNSCSNVSYSKEMFINFSLHHTDEAEHVESYADDDDWN